MNEMFVIVLFTEQIDAIVNCTLIRVKNNTKLTNFMI